MLRLPQSIDRKSWAAMLKYSSLDLVDENTLAIMDECEKLLFKTAEPKGTFAIAGVPDFEGNNIKRHLEGCHKVVIIGITLGRAVDDAIMRMQITDMTKGVILDSGASILCDATCDLFEKDIKNEIGKDDIFFTSRYSPGYGDMPLSEQQKVIKMLDATRRIGLTLSSGDLMIPMKSITAIVGIADHPVSGHVASCDECLIREKCEKRKTGDICASK